MLEIYRSWYTLYTFGYIWTRRDYYDITPGYPRCASCPVVSPCSTGWTTEERIREYIPTGIQTPISITDRSSRTRTRRLFEKLPVKKRIAKTRANRKFNASINASIRIRTSINCYLRYYKSYINIPVKVLF